MIIFLMFAGGPVNDTLIGDPLLTVPLPSDSMTDVKMSTASLCYEVYGMDDTYFNLLSDGCVSVNAHYVKLNSYLNVVDKIAIRAVDEKGTCKNIEVDLNGCAVLVNRMPLKGHYRSAGIVIRPSANKVRISVPNCNETSTLVMWTICQNNVLNDPFEPDRTFSARMIKFVIARGININESAHGIIGEIDNIIYIITCTFLRHLFLIRLIIVYLVFGIDFDMEYFLAVD